MSILRTTTSVRCRMIDRVSRHVVALRWVAGPPRWTVACNQQRPSKQQDLEHFGYRHRADIDSAWKFALIILKCERKTRTHTGLWCTFYVDKIFFIIQCLYMISAWHRLIFKMAYFPKITKRKPTLKQESLAIAKMTARCALYIYIYCMPWKFSRVPEYAHGYFSRNF